MMEVSSLRLTTFSNREGRMYNRVAEESRKLASMLYRKPDEK
jgi:hypothetical protein